MKKWLVRAGIAFCVLAGLGILLTAGIGFYLESGHARKWIQGRLDESIAGRVRWSEVHLSLFRGRVEIAGLVLESPSQQPLIGAERIAVELSWRALLSWAVLLEEVKIDRPSARLRMEPDGRLDLSMALDLGKKKDRERPKEAVPFPFNVQVRDFNLSGGTFLFSSHVGGRVEGAHLEKIQLFLKDIDLAKKSGFFGVTCGKGGIDLAGIKTGWEDFQVEARVEAGEIRPVRARMNSEALTLALEGDGRDLAGDPGIEARLTIETTLEDIRRTFHLVRDMAGTLKIELAASGKVSNPRVKAALAYGGGRVSGVEVSALKMEGLLSDRELTLNLPGIKTPYGHGNLSAAADLRAAFPRGFLSSERRMEAVAFQVDLESSHSDVKKLPFKGMPFGGSFKSSVRVEGKGVSFENLEAEAVLDLTGVAVSSGTQESPAVWALRAKTSFSKKTVGVRGFALNLGKTVLSGDGSCQLETEAIKARVSLSAPDLFQTGSLLGIRSLSGSLDTAADLSGFLQKPVAEVEVEGRALVFENRRLGDLSAELFLENGRLFARPLQVRKDGALLLVEGRMDLLDPKTLKLAPDPAMDLQVEARDVSLSEVDEGMAGTVRLAGRLAGTTRHPEGSLDLEGNRIDLFGQKIDRVTAKTRIREGRVFLEPLTLFLAPGERLDGTGWVSYSDKTFSLLVRSPGLSLARIHWLSEAGIDQGKASLEVSGGGKLENPEAAGTFTFSGITIRDKDLKEIRVQASLADLELKVSAASDFDLQARLHLEKLDFEARAAFSQTALAPYFEMAGLKRLTGVLSGKAACRGNLREMERIQADVDLAGLQLLFDDQPLLISKSFRVSLKDSAVTASDVRFDLLREGHVEVLGKANLEGKMDLSVRGAIPLKGLSPLIPQLGETGGEAALLATVRGTMSKPEMAGRMDLKNVRFTPPGLLQEIQGVDAVVNITPDAVKVEKLSGKMGLGQFDISGNIGIKGVNPSSFALTLDARKIPYSVPGALDVSADARISLNGTLERSALTGEIIVAEGIYFKDVDLNPLQAFQGRERPAAPTSPKSFPPFLQNLTLDVSIRHKNPFVVDNNIALLSIVSDLQLKGSLPEPRLLGKAQVKEGTIAFLGREFEITRGVIDFVNPYRIEPVIDIKSKIEIRKWTIFLEIAGTPDNLVFTRTSVPPENEEDVAMLLTVGKTRQEMVQQEGGSWIGSKALAAQLAAELVGDPIKDVTGLDIFEAKYLEKEDASESDGVEVTVGKALSKRLTVKYSLDTRGGESTQRVLSEYRLIENVAASAFQENSGNYGAQMVYRLEFR